MSQGYGITLSAVQFTGNTSQPAQVSNSTVYLATDNGATLGLVANVPTSSTNGIQLQQNGVTGVQFFKSSGPTVAVNMVASQSTQGMLISGASSITGNIFECDLTSGGTLALKLTAAGAFNVGANAGASTAGDIGAAQTAAKGAYQFGSGIASSGGTLDYGVHVGGIFTFAGQTTTQVAAGYSGTLGAGSFQIPTNAGTGFTLLTSSSSSAGSTSVNGGVLCVQNSNGTINMTMNGSSNMGIAGTAYANSSSASTKTNIGPMPYDPIADLRATEIVSFQALAEIAECKELGVPCPIRIGPIAENLPTSMREGIGGFNLTSAIAILLASAKIIESRVTSLEGKSAAPAG